MTAPRLPRIRIAFLIGIALLLLACDKSYQAHISVTLPSSSAKTAESVASDLLKDLTARFDLRCEPPEVWRAPDGSTAGSEMHHECTERRGYTRVAVVASTREVSVDVDRISGFSEPATFRAIRLAALEHLQQAVPGAAVTMDYPSQQ